MRFERVLMYIIALRCYNKRLPCLREPNQKPIEPNRSIGSAIEDNRAGTFLWVRLSSITEPNRTQSNPIERLGSITNVRLTTSGIIQPGIACSRPYCRCFNACTERCKTGMTLFRQLWQTKQRAIRSNEPYDRFLHSRICESAPDRPEARLKSHVNRCHISAGTHKIKSAVLVSGVPFQKSTLKKLEHILSCKSSGPCPKLLARVPKFWSAVPKMNVV